MTKRNILVLHYIWNLNLYLELAMTLINMISNKKQSGNCDKKKSGLLLFIYMKFFLC